MKKRRPDRRGSGRESAQTSRRQKDQSRLTSAATLREDAPPYRVDGPPISKLAQAGSESGAPTLGQGSALFIDLFCGIGGFRLAFERAGGRCVFSSDWDKFSQQTYAANFGETPHYPSLAGAGEGAEGG